MFRWITSLRCSTRRSLESSLYHQRCGQSLKQSCVRGRGHRVSAVDLGHVRHVIPLKLRERGHRKEASKVVQCVCQLPPLNDGVCTPRAVVIPIVWSPFRGFSFGDVPTVLHAFSALRGSLLWV